MIVDSTVSKIEFQMQHNVQVMLEVEAIMQTSRYMNCNNIPVSRGVELVATYFENGPYGHEDTPTVVNDSARRTNGVYTIPQNAIQVSPNTFVTKLPGKVKWGAPDDKVKKSHMHAWHPEHGLFHGRVRSPF